MLNQHILSANMRVFRNIAKIESFVFVLTINSNYFKIIFFCFLKKFTQMRRVFPVSKYFTTRHLKIVVGQQWYEQEKSFNSSI